MVGKQIRFLITHVETLNFTKKYYYHKYIFYAFAEKPYAINNNVLFFN